MLFQEIHTDSKFHHWNIYGFPSFSPPSFMRANDFVMNQSGVINIKQSSLPGMSLLNNSIRRKQDNRVFKKCLESPHLSNICLVISGWRVLATTYILFPYLSTYPGFYNKKLNFYNHKERIICKLKIHLLNSQGSCSSHTKMRKIRILSQASQTH